MTCSFDAHTKRLFSEVQVYFTERCKIFAARKERKISWYLVIEINCNCTKAATLLEASEIHLNKHNKVTNRRQHKHQVGSVAVRVKASFLRRPRSHDLGSTRTQVTWLRPWIRRFTMIISAWWLRTKQHIYVERSQTSTGKLGTRSTPKRVRIRPK